VLRAWLRRAAFSLAVAMGVSPFGHRQMLCVYPVGRTHTHRMTTNRRGVGRPHGG